MREVLDDIERWRAGGHRVAIARVVGVDGSGPRDPGATMVVNDDGEVAGSVSGGCVEGAVVSEALAVLAGRRPPAWCRSATPTTTRSRSGSRVAGRSTCSSNRSTGDRAGDPVSADPAPVYDALRDALRADVPVALATVTDAPGVGVPAVGAKLMVRPGQEPFGSLGDPDLDRVVARDVLGELEAGLTSTRHYGVHGEARERAVAVFIESFAPAPRMVIFGAVDFTAALARAGKLLGYRVTVCDARPVFVTPQRFPMADEVVNDWPDRYLAKIAGSLGPRDVVCVLTHDEKFDVPAIVGARDVGRVSRCDGLTPHPREAGHPPARSRRRRRGSRPRHGADRTRHRRSYAGGDRDRGLRRDHRPADGAPRAVLAGRGGSDPHLTGRAPKRSLEDGSRDRGAARRRVGCVGRARACGRGGARGRGCSRRDLWA